MRWLLLVLIRFYQRHLSPRKGFRCAYAVDTGRASCSELGRRAIRRYGAVEGIGILRMRFGACSHSASRLAQRGSVSCDLPSDGATLDACPFSPFDSIDVDSCWPSGPDLPGCGGCATGTSPNGELRERERARRRRAASDVWTDARRMAQPSARAAEIDPM